MIVTFFFTITSTTSASVLTFDDVITGNQGYIPDGYAGFDWMQMGVMNPDVYGEPYTLSGYNNGRVSGDYVAFNANGYTGFMSSISGDPFDFNGAYFTAVWNNGLNIKVIGYTGSSPGYFLTGTPIYEQIITVDTFDATWFQFNFTGIDALSFESYGGTNAGYTGGSGVHFAMEEFTYNAVPIPAAVWLFGSGLIGLIGIARRKKA